MSFTSTIPPITSRTNAVKVNLSPSKKRPISPDGAFSDSGPAPSSREIWQWTLTKAAIAPCFVKDVFDMKESGVRANDDYFWLGRVPCRTVQLVGVLVGVQAYEKRVIYYVDDGSAVIECAHKHQPPPSTPRKSNKPRSKYQPIASSSVVATPLEVALARPIAGVGTSVRIVGRVKTYKRTRQIEVDEIDRCLSVNDEPNHWRMVASLHRDHYSLPIPFVVPAAVALVATASVLPHAEEPQTPKRSNPLPNSSPFSTRTTSSPAKSIPHASPPRLRHPSRLHRQDLTANTFRIYLKHYMDHATPPRTTGLGDNLSDLRSESTDDEDGFPETPTKRIHHRQRGSRHRLSGEVVDSTPRPGKKISGSAYCHYTPKPYRCNSAVKDEDVRPGGFHGFTLSYLRRVPELAHLASRIVQAEGRRRAREERKAGKTKPADTKPKEKLKTKTKRLFVWAVVKLHEEGSIVLWDGPVRDVDMVHCGDMWKGGNDSVASRTGVSMLSCSSTAIGFESEDEDEGELSDPPVGEDAYIPLNAAYLANVVEAAIKSLTERSVTKTLRSFQRPPAPDGPTKDEITRYLKKSDERWARLGDWIVQETLELLKEEGRVWSVASDRWLLCSPEC
ncbi:hypothetical protein JAAARDRAFT_671986 [Jaapia argillacea MUCL 33604]|uniref:CST complex subunit STN1 n=1 Tax=Jaapia argillacea MUCL 33604 TaxID=933084 RepID=A0A067PXF3_9AGAM|nr:hypothetical protein JAAARDRAFT_671986 [Jaapia argillacea MUCL 33604]